MMVMLNYQRPPPAGKRTGRNIGNHTNVAHDLVDIHEPTKVRMNNARTTSASLGSTGFELRDAPTPVINFEQPEAVRQFYDFTRALVKEATGADRVVTFDHTLRESGNTNLNAIEGQSKAGAVVRVHGDYTPASGPKRLGILNDSGKIDAKAPRRFAFVNVWRSVDHEHPVMANPLAVCSTSSIDLQDAWPYLMMYEDRIGENYALHNEQSDSHEWYYYPRMLANEALLFKVFDSAEDVPRFVFHTAFDDPSTPEGAPPRRSVEVRTIALWD